MNNPIYFDNNATTPVDPEVKTAFIDALELFGNASSMHGFGRTARQAVEEARSSLAALIGADTKELLFSGGGSESNNMVLKSVLHPDHPRHRGKVIISTIEHPCVLESARYLQKLGVAVSEIGVDPDGKVDLKQLEGELDESVALISIMLANNEIGTIQDIGKISGMAKKYGIPVHTDAVQAVGKIPVDVDRLGIDYLTLSAHKLYAPKGVGALYHRPGAPLFPLIHGGHQEEGLRAGTINAPSIIAFGTAAAKASQILEEERKTLWELREHLRRGIEERISDIRINGHEKDVLPGTLDISFFGAEGESILLYLDIEGIGVSTGSACATGSLEPSHVLLATGVSAGLAHGSIRFSLGRFNTKEEVEILLDKLPGIIERIRKMSTVKPGEVGK
jgi:cysteine desulfurase